MPPTARVHPLSGSRMARAIPLFPLHAFMAWTGIYLLFVYNPLYADALYSVCTVNCIDFNIVDRLAK
jgi:hypothetical protein